MPLRDLRGDCEGSTEGDEEGEAVAHGSAERLTADEREIDLELLPHPLLLAELLTDALRLSRSDGEGLGVEEVLPPPPPRTAVVLPRTEVLPRVLEEAQADTVVLAEGGKSEPDGEAVANALPLGSSGVAVPAPPDVSEAQPLAEALGTRDIEPPATVTLPLPERETMALPLAAPPENV